MKALSLRQPWAWLVAHGIKDVENRRWNTRYRGEFLIHAAKGITAREHAEACDWAYGEMERTVSIPSWCDDEGLPRGGIVGIARLVDVIKPVACHGCAHGHPLVRDVHHAPDGDGGLCLREPRRRWHVPEQFGFVLEDVRPLPFRPCRGALGFFEPKE